MLELSLEAKIDERVSELIKKRLLKLDDILGVEYNHISQKFLIKSRDRIGIDDIILNGLLAIGYKGKLN
ncbi:MAG: hypothetical protein COB15_01325 [Flavobacteriales bacterium]|nr:MAG: hypothetical protein COB15_01325 [Flavobacteriales bacterium]